MFYYNVAVGSNSRGSKSAFTYSSEEKIPDGVIVRVPLRSKTVYGYIVNTSTKPDFETTPISLVTGDVLPSHIREALKALTAKYPYSSQQIIRQFLPPSSKSVADVSSQRAVVKVLKPLNAQQESIVKQISAAKRSAVLFGDTGTGKTRCYVHLCAEMIREGKDTLILEPEIGLAEFIANEVSQAIEGVLVYHSGLSVKKRQQLWKTVLSSSTPVVVIGPRSSLGLPFKSLGLVIIDEAHDASYRADSPPYVSTQTIVHDLVTAHDAYYIYATATPLVADLKLAQLRGVPIYRLTEQAVAAPKSTHIEVISAVDSVNGQRILRKPSIEILRQAFSNGKQALVLLNRRGTARNVRCTNCNYEAACPRCESGLVYHHDRHQLRCHYCEHRQKMPSVCPFCKSGSLIMKAFGSKALEAELRSLFPHITMRRFDTDNNKQDSLATNKDEVISGRIQCIIGTQMVAKGLDLPQLAALVVVDTLSNGNLDSDEQRFQLLYQVTGRAVRGHQATEVIIQTQQPEAPLFADVLGRDVESFNERELAERKQFYYPPYCHMMLIHYSRKTQAQAQAAGSALVERLRATAKIIVMDATANSVEKQRGRFHWHITVKSPKRSILRTLAEELGPSWICQLDAQTTP